MKRNIVSSRPCNPENIGDEEKNINRLVGFHFPKHAFNLILFLSIISLIIIFILSSFEAFLLKFREAENNNENFVDRTAVLVLKIVTVVIFLLKFVGKSLNITYRSGV